MGTAAVAVRAPLVPLGLVPRFRDDPVQPDGDLPVSVVAGVQVDQCGPRRPVPHAVHQFAERCG
jgi:hypothetical protein